MKKTKAQIEYEKKFNKISQKLHGNQPSQQEKKKTASKPINSQQKISKAQRDGVKYDVVQKSTTNKKSQVSNVGKLLNEDIDIKEVPKEIATQVQKARNEHKLTQDQLAKKIQENVSVVKDLESATGQYNPKVVEKIEKALNVKFERSWKK
jgi:ribosome-binding protein aMBF1 (putative translation factor)